MSLFHRERGKGRGGEEVLWIECPFCKEISFRKEVERHLWACPKCTYHRPISVTQRIQFTLDAGTFEELFRGVSSADPLEFKDEKRYSDRLREARQETRQEDAVVCGRGVLLGHRVLLAIQDFFFMGGSMGSAVGEKVCRLAEEALRTQTPLILFAASGGARMQEGLISLMQMARTTVTLAPLKEAGIPFVTILTDPTTGGVAASFAMQGDVILAEPRARVGFAGPRVIEQTMREKLPAGFQRAEYLLEHGLIDDIVSRTRLREVLGSIVGILSEPIPTDKG